MQLLPIVHRELRVAARQPRTWWRRVLTFFAASAIFVMVWIDAGQSSTPSVLGRSVFSALTVFGFLYAVLAGPMATVDCLSRERREGTLGLLFLTDLRGYDVVLGKVASCSLDVMLGLLSVLPLLAIPLLMGGVTLALFGKVVLMLWAVMFFSLAFGALFSALCTSARVSLGLTLLALLLLNAALPFFSEEVLKIPSQSKISRYLYTCCPLWAMALCLRGISGFGTSGYWLCVGGLHLYGSVLLIVACVRTARDWDETERSPWAQWPSKRLGSLLRLNRVSARIRRRMWLDRNPVAWLELRDSVQGRLLGLLVTLCVLFVLFCAIQLRAPSRWPGTDVMFFWPMWSHYLCCLWIAIQAPRRLADDKSSGALELLLCTSLSPEEAVSGLMRALRRRFGVALVTLVFLDAFLVCAYCSQHRLWWSRNTSLAALCFWATAVFLIQGYAFARVGLYQGLVRGNSLKATFNLIFTLGILPWLLFAGWLITIESLRKYLPPFFWSGRELFVFNSWGIAHLLVFGVFLARSSSQLRRNFRSLAAAPAVSRFGHLFRKLNLAGS